MIFKVILLKNTVDIGEQTKDYIYGYLIDKKQFSITNSLKLITEK